VRARLGLDKSLPEQFVVYVRDLARGDLGQSVTTGQPVRAGSVREGRRWIVEDFDLASSLRYRAERTLTLGAWLRSLRGVEEAAYFAPDDLRPLLAMCGGRMGKLVRRVSRALARRRRVRRAPLRPADGRLARAPARGRVQGDPIMCNERLAPELDPSAG